MPAREIVLVLTNYKMTMTCSQYRIINVVYSVRWKQAEKYCRAIAAIQWLNLLRITVLSATA